MSVADGRAASRARAGRAAGGAAHWRLLLAGALLFCTGPAAASTVAERADALMRDLAQRALFQGAVVIGTLSGEVHYAAGFGHADVERRVPFTPDTPTDGGSIAKTFTAAALLQLVAEGRIDLEAPVRSVVPEFPHAATRLRHLLVHSAGLPEYEWLDARVAPGAVRTNASHLALVARDAPAPRFEPGTAFAYDNVAYDVAAMAVERIERTSFATVLSTRFFRPLGLQAQVRPARFDAWPGVRTRGYRRTPAGLTLHDAYDLEGFHGGGNVYLSARDLFRWVGGVRRLVGEEAARHALAPARLDDGRATGLSLGSWYVADDGRHYYTGHHNGFYSVGYADPARDIAIAWVANDAPPPWLQPALTRALVAVAAGRPPEGLTAPDTVRPVGDPDGTYRVEGVGDVALRSAGRRRIVRVAAVEYESFPVARGTHYVPGLDAVLRVVPGAGGDATLEWSSVYLGRRLGTRTSGR